MDKYDANLHSLTPVAVYDDSYYAIERKETKEEMENKFEIVGLNISERWDSYFLIEIPESGKHRQGSLGRMTLNIPMRHQPEPLYKIGDRVAVGWSSKYKHFYIERRK